jgi:saccharopine dehydrogenase-like NADP-dependent oxidoreductase
MTVTVVEKLLLHNDTHICIGSRTLKPAQEICEVFPKNTSAVEIDIFNAEALSALVQKYDLIISYIPPYHHMEVIRACLANNKHFCSSSYISPDIQGTHDQWVEKNLICLNEMGVDPGIDILSTIKVRDDCKEQGIKIVGYESWCGALPACEHTDNPLGYKFSWAPGASVKASKNTAIYRQGGEVKTVTEPLKDVVIKDDFSPCIKLESYPNRDSLVFQERFGMQDCETFIRGTLRYKGFSYIISAFHDVGLTAEKPVPEGITTLKQLVESALKDAVEKDVPAQTQAAMDKVMIGAQDDQIAFFKRFISQVDLAHVPED